MAAILFAISSIIFFFEDELLSFYWSEICPSPVIWKNLKIHLPKDMIYELDSKKIVFAFWHKKIGGSMSISNFSSNPDTFLLALKKQGYVIIDSSYSQINDNMSFQVKYKLPNSSSIHISTLVIPFQILFHFEGKWEEYQLFECIFNNLEMLNYKKAEERRAAWSVSAKKCVWIQPHIWGCQWTCSLGSYIALFAPKKLL